jgi:GT2 family glycosyltransferase
MSWHGLHAWHPSEVTSAVLEYSAWAIAIAWCVRVRGVIVNLHKIADLSGMEWDVSPVGAPSLTVVVPAKDEAENIAATCEALLMADYPRLKIVCVDDRSLDSTGAIMEEFAARAAGKIEVLHITDLPEGWLGKTFAMEEATRQSDSDWLLFTDADVLFSPSILRRALAYAEVSGADHLVVMPTVQVKTRGEGMMLGFLQLLGMWRTRPWRIADAKSQIDSVGVGAFNLIRRTALEELGGWAPQRLAVVEDVTLGHRVKAAGMRQRVAFAPGLVLLHWAAGVRGIVRVLTKNMFASVGFQPLLMLAVIALLLLFCVAPVAEILWWRTLAPSALVLLSVAAAYRTIATASRIDARYGWLFPVGALMTAWAMLRSMAVTLWERGVTWRGTKYPLWELRRHNSPWQWEMMAARERRMAKGKG